MLVGIMNTIVFEPDKRNEHGERRQHNKIQESF
ncbi:hypothetical protein OIU76_026387, partial [Salix suchowensis]